jgi:anti-anti-sigma regulatory factor
MSGRNPFRVTTERPCRNVVVLRLAGDLGEAEVPGLWDLLKYRLCSSLRTVVLDLTEVSSLNESRVRLLGTAKKHAALNGIRLLVHGDNIVVHQAIGSPS